MGRCPSPAGRSLAAKTVETSRVRAARSAEEVARDVWATLQIFDLGYLHVKVKQLVLLFHALSLLPLICLDNLGELSF